MATLTVGFTGGLTVTREVASGEIESLRASLARDDRPWHELQTNRGLVVLALPRLAYYEIDDSERRPGFD